MADIDGVIAIPFEFKLASDQAGSFSGYGSVFGVTDKGGDCVMPGAFKASLAQSMPKMYVNHAGMPFGTTTANDMIPVGKWTKAAEDSKGLAVEGVLTDDGSDRFKMVYGAMKSGTMDGLSIGYRATNFTRGSGPNEPARKINEAKLIEVSPVADPMNPAARIIQVKSGMNPRDIRYLESVLRDAGLTRTEAKAVLADGFKALALRDAAEGEELAALLKRAAATIQPSKQEQRNG